MPELPEVETVARTLAPDIVGKKICSFSCLNESSWEDGLDFACLNVAQPKIQAVGRKGKLLLIYFSPFSYMGQEILGLAFHLKMSGRLFYYAEKKELEKHTRLVLHLEKVEVFFDDVRKFGYCRFLTNKSAENWKFWRNLAKDPLEMRAEEFLQALEGKNAGIKSVLLRQDIVSGIGNIYADEALFRAKILPHRKTCSLQHEEIVSLFQRLREVLLESIAFCGSSIKDYRTAKGDVGSFQNKFNVYGREGEKCRVCKQILEKTTAAGRTTVFCPCCQK